MKKGRWVLIEQQAAKKVPTIYQHPCFQGLCVGHLWAAQGQHDWIRKRSPLPMTLTEGHPGCSGAVPGDLELNRPTVWKGKGDHAKTDSWLMKQSAALSARWDGSINLRNMARFLNLQTLLLMPRQYQSKHRANRYERHTTRREGGHLDSIQSSVWGDEAFAYIWSMSPLKGKHYASH